MSAPAEPLAPDLGQDAPPPGTTRRVFRPRLLVTLIFLVMLGCLVSLGQWQVNRFQQARDGIAAFAAQHDQPPVRALGVVPGALADRPRLKALHFRRADLEGTLEPERAVLLTARYMFGRRGYGVMMPLRLGGDAGQRGPATHLLAHLGWVPEDKVAEYLKSVAEAPARRVMGRLQVPPTDPPVRQVGEFVGRPTWPRASPSDLAASFPGLDPRLMIQAGNLAVGDPVDPTRVPLDGYAHPVRMHPSKHAEYAATWYGLAVALIGVWIALSLQRVPLAGAAGSALTTLVLLLGLGFAGAAGGVSGGCGSGATAEEDAGAAAKDSQRHPDADVAGHGGAGRGDSGSMDAARGADGGDPDVFADSGVPGDIDVRVGADGDGGGVGKEPGFWLRTHGGPQRDTLEAVAAYADGSALALGTTESGGAGGRDLLLVRLSPCGAPVSARTYGAAGRDEGRALALLADGGAILAGTTESFGEANEALVLRVGADGAPAWARAVGGKSWDTAAAVTATSDDGAVVVGETYSFGPKSPTKHNLFLFRLDKAGELVYERTYGGDKEGDAGFAVIYQPKDDGALVGGASESFGQGKDDAWLLRVDAAGKLLWSRTYGGTGDDEGRGLLQLASGELMVSGFTRSFGAAKSDAFLLRLDAAGNLLGMSRHGSPGDDRGLCALPRPDGGVVLLGVTDHWDGAQDGHALALDGKGKPIWHKRIGGEQLDEVIQAVPMSQGALLFVGFSESYGNGVRDGLAGRIRSDGEGGCKVRDPSSPWSHSEVQPIQAEAAPQVANGAAARVVDVQSAPLSLPLPGKAAIVCLDPSCP